MEGSGLILGAGLGLLGTTLGAAGVFALKRMPITFMATVIAYGAGMMMFSAIEMVNASHALAGHWMAFAGMVAGMLVVLLLAKSLPHAHLLLLKDEMPVAKRKVVVLVGTITIHNIPEGFAIASAFVTSPSLGWLVAASVALQDIPEGLIVSMPAACYGTTPRRAFCYGVLSGVVEFVAAIIGYFFLRTLSEATPFALGFSGGAMLYVVIFELLPDAMHGETRHKGAMAFLAGIATAYLLSVVAGS